MTLPIANAPCSWGVDDPDNPHLPAWETVLKEAAQAGYQSIESGPVGYLPEDDQVLTAALNRYGLSLVAGTLFDDLVSEAHFPHLLALTHRICRRLAAVPTARKTGAPGRQPPYLVIIDFGHDERARFAGQSARSPRLPSPDRQRMMRHIAEISRVAWEEYGVRPVVHPHAGGYIEFADELEMLMAEIPHELAGLCLDTGHLYYAGMDPVTWLDKCWPRIDYLHFKDVDRRVFASVLARGTDFFSACAEGVMCPLGRGEIDYAAVHDLLVRRGYDGWITIEQERDPRNAAGSLQDVTASLRYLRETGF